MSKSWSDCKNILCIRADNMGDLLMSSPAFRALKETFNSRITVLTSSMAAGIAKYLPGIDDTIVCDFPWVKTNGTPDTDDFIQLIEVLHQREFDAAVIFTVYSQNPLPAAMLAYLARIPNRLGYCRENPYQLLTHWIPDKEPYDFINHQVRRDLNLVKHVGAATKQENLTLNLPDHPWVMVVEKIRNAGIDLNKPWILLHPGVSEKKREYPRSSWINSGKKIITELKHQVLLTGTTGEKAICDELAENIGEGACSLAGAFNLEEFMMLIKHASLIISVNTGTVHIAAALSTPVIVLYALSNPQHLPWKLIGKALFFSIPRELRSRNEVIQYVHGLMEETEQTASPENIIKAAKELLSQHQQKEYIRELVPLKIDGI